MHRFIRKYEVITVHVQVKLSISCMRFSTCLGFITHNLTIETTWRYRKNYLPVSRQTKLAASWLTVWAVRKKLGEASREYIYIYTYVLALSCHDVSSFKCIWRKIIQKDIKYQAWLYYSSTVILVFSGTKQPIYLLFTPTLACPI